MKTVIILEENTKDLADIPENVKDRLQITPVARMDDVLRIALTRPPEPKDWDEAASAAAAAATASDSSVEQDQPVGTSFRAH
jgi:ATP-dependent Lon protease